jgi:uncharacterized membrane protein YjjP (DUF1212 family)
MMGAVLSPPAVDRVPTEELELLECLRKIGKGLIASNVSVGVVENTLTEIAQIYDVECEIMALPNLIMIELGQSSRGRVDFAVQRSHRIGSVSEIAELSDRCRWITSWPRRRASNR